ncbi:MAG: threonine synthase [Spirochaetales bacterium]|jgi:threonine synthase|nr:threonine synthase [Spirochaetales bacterium]
MIFASTKNPRLRIDFSRGVFQGLAPDGGLYHPVETPDLSRLFKSLSPRTDFTDLASQVTAELLKDEITSHQAGEICGRAFTFAPRLVYLPPDPEAPENSGPAILELYHGPSCAFKDFGACFLASCMEEFLGTEKREAVILTATSGDTGSAVAQAFHHKKNIEVVILYPSGRVSPLQEKQLTTLGGNIRALEVQGSFDDCQAMVKAAFVDPVLIKRLTLSSANSINIGRLIPQAFYYLWAWIKTEQKELRFCVPSGNFGNLTAGVLAWTWGMGVSGFLAATNRNNVVPEYLNTGQYRPRPSLQTCSNAMDVGSPSNFDRLLAIFKGDWKKMREVMSGAEVNDENTLKTIAQVYREKAYLMDPHTAVGYHAGMGFRKKHPAAEPLVILSTAHPGKFAEVIEKAVNQSPPLPAALSALADKPKQAVLIDSNFQSLKDFLLKNY